MDLPFIPNMGTHLILDFVGVDSVDLNNYDQVYQIMTEAISLSNAQIIRKIQKKKLFLDCQYKKFEPQGLTIVFTLSESHMSIHTWPEYGSCAIDFYNCGETSKENCKNVKNYLSSILGENKITSELIIPRGQSTLLATNNNGDKLEIYKNVTLLHREISEKQKIEVYDIPMQGKSLLLNNNISIQEVQKQIDTYSENICKLTFESESLNKNVLIIGGGDLMQARCILQNYPNTEKIVVCDWDPRVTEICEQYFGIDDNLKESIQSGKLQIFYEDGQAFVNKIQMQNQKFDIVIIDTINYQFDDYDGQPLFNKQFFIKLEQIMSNNSIFCLRLESILQDQAFYKMCQESGFSNKRLAKSQLQGQSGMVPVGVARKLKYTGIT